MERKALPLEVKDLDTSKRTAIIAHAAYDNIDRVNDVSRKGMFTKSWNESKSDISLYLNHDDTLAPGRVEDVFEDGDKAMTKAWFGTHTLGNDTLIMMDEKVIRFASFGYITEKSNPITIKGKSVRELKEVRHLETSVLTKLPANPKSGVVSVTKAMFPTEEVKAMSTTEFSILKQIATMDQQALAALVQLSGDMETTSDLYNWILWQISRRADLMSNIRSELRYNAPELKALTQHVETMESFCRNTKASDECIKSVLVNIEEAKQIISSYDTADTRLINEPAASSGDNDSKAYMKQLLLINARLTA
jgi:hypothetical protein